MNQPLFITGIGTDVGKTVAAAVVVEALSADYWKPVQAGNLTATDTDRVRALVSNARTRCHPERFRLAHPLSPHAAAAREGISMRVGDFSLPTCESGRVLVVEGAGGLMVPINERELMIDLIGHLNARVILVSQHYLGSINHTLLSLEALAARGLPVAGLLFNGDENPETEAIIAARSTVRSLGRIAREPVIDASCVARYARELRASLLRTMGS